MYRYSLKCSEQGDLIRGYIPNILIYKNFHVYSHLGVRRTHMYSAWGTKGAYMHMLEIKFGNGAS